MRSFGRGSGFGREKGIKALAWISYGFAVVGGAALAATFLGDWLSGLVGLFPAWVPIVVFAGGLVAMAVDLMVDLVPNRIALYAAMTLPSLARAVPGRLGQTVTELCKEVLRAVNEALGEWLGTTSAFAVMATCLIVSLLMARRVIAKGGR